jgi:acetyl esterase/lipase
MANMILEDPRIDPRLKAMFAAMPEPNLPNMPDRETLLAQAAATWGAMADTPQPAPALYEAVAPRDGLNIQTIAIASQPDGNSINLQVITPEGGGPFPCVYYIHGGGMMMSSCFEPAFAAFGRLIAANGVVVVMVDFRNCLFPSSVTEVAPFPAGLNDCVSGLQWVCEHTDQLNIDPARIIVAGESGGANLSLAVALKLKRDSNLGVIAGVSVSCPYMAGEWKGGAGSSAEENAGILMDTRSNYGAMAYGIEELRNRNPLAWPGFATEEDVAGFPPVSITVNECDPLRDDGVNVYRLLLRAGVSARCKQIMGTVHATEIYVLPCPEISRDAARELATFALEAP